MKLGWVTPVTPVAGMNTIANAEQPSEFIPQVYIIGELNAFECLETNALSNSHSGLAAHGS